MATMQWCSSKRGTIGALLGQNSDDRIEALVVLIVSVPTLARLGIPLLIDYLFYS